MAERFTKSAARNIFYGGSVFFFVTFVALTIHSHYYMRTVSTDESTVRTCTQIEGLSECRAVR